jgi:hypothetical protein
MKIVGKAHGEVKGDPRKAFRLFVCVNIGGLTPSM